MRSEKDGGPKSNSSKVITTLASNNSNKGRDEVAIITCIRLVARVSQNKKSTWKSEISLEIRNQFGNQKSTWKSEINLEIRNQSLEIRNQVRNHGDLKSRTLFSEVSYPSSLANHQRFAKLKQSKLITFELIYSFAKVFIHALSPNIIATKRSCYTCRFAT